MLNELSLLKVDNVPMLKRVFFFDKQLWVRHQILITCLLRILIISINVTVFAELMLENYNDVKYNKYKHIFNTICCATMPLLQGTHVAKCKTVCTVEKQNSTRSSIK